MFALLKKIINGLKQIVERKVHIDIALPKKNVLIPIGVIP